MPISERIEEGEPHHRIVTLARDEGFDLIVMGTLGRTGRPLALVDSVADSVVRTASLPVLTVRDIATAARNARTGGRYAPLHAGGPNVRDE